jgi:hypothetical protein
MKRLLPICGALILGALLASAQGRTLQVQIHYTGSGTVDATHKIYVALWGSPDLTGGPPTAVQSTASKNGSVTFSDLQTSPVYVSAAYDPSGQWDASSPPPAGSSLGMFSTAPPKPDPVNLTPGKIAKVTITFDDKNKAQ